MVSESLTENFTHRNDIQIMETGFLNAKTRKDSLPLLLPSEITRKETLLLQCEVMFGSPSSNCGGNGICKIVTKSHNPLRMFKRTHCSHAKAFFAACDGGNGASMLFRREWLCSNLMKRHFRHAILEMPEPCPIPPAFVAALGLKISELPAGLHLIEDYGTHLSINFRRIPS